MCRYQIVSHLGLVLQGSWQPNPGTTTSTSTTYSPLYGCLASCEASQGLVLQLIDGLHQAGEPMLEAVFTPLLQHCLR